MTITKQTTKDATWIDESGNPIPYKRTTQVERMKEIYAFDLANEAVKVNKRLLEFKEVLRKKCQEVYDVVMGEKKTPGKGNYTWFNFDGSIKIEVAINESIDFDGMLIEKCKEKLMELVGESINPEAEFIKELVMSAFQTSKGKLDTKKVLSLKKHSSRIKDKRYHEAMKYLDESIRRPESKTYYRVWVRNSEGQYESIDLNFSSI